MVTLLLRRSLVLFLIALAIGACTPQLAGIQNATQLDDNFSSNQNNWDEGSTEHSERSLQNGALTITVKSANWSAWASPGVLLPEDVDVQVDVVMATAATAPDWEYRIQVRGSGRSGDATFYICGITETGHWFISVHTGPSQNKSLKGGNISTRIDSQKGNTLRCVAKGDLIKIYFDGQILGSVKDSTLPPNGNPKYIHLATYNGKNGDNPTQAVFRNLKVRPAQ
jgi:hypothetical protein